MKNLWKKLISAVAAIAVTSSLAFAYTVVLDGIGLGGTTAPALTTCGTSPVIVGNDMAGTVTTGTATPTACTVTFNTAKSVAPACAVTSQSQLASFAYTLSTTAIVIAQTGTNSNKFNYVCMGQ